MADVAASPDYTVPLTLYVYEAGLLAARLPPLSACDALRQTLLAAGAACQQQASGTFAVTVCAQDMGFLIGCVADVSCKFTGDLRAYLCQKAIGKLVSMGITGRT